MFSRKKPENTQRRQHNLAQFGLTEIPDDFDPTAGYGNDDEGDDSDLEAELAAIVDGNGKVKPKPKPKAQLLPTADLEAMVSESLRDVSDDDDNEDLDNDQDLLGELQTISTNDGNDLIELDDTPANNEESSSTEQNKEQVYLPTSTVDTLEIIQNRLQLYKQAEANAKASGEGAKARRFGRGVKTLQDLLKQAKAGKSINVDEIPPEVGVKSSAPASSEITADDAPKLPTRTAPAPPPSSQSNESSPEETNLPAKVAETSNTTTDPRISELRSRQAEYKKAALQYKRDGDTATALQLLKVVKQFDVVVNMCENGQTVDLSDMPPPPSEFFEFMSKMQQSIQTPPTTADESGRDVTPPEPQDPKTETASEAEHAQPETILEALQQRLDKYRTVEQAAKAEGNASKARRFGRIVKQYEDAIKNEKSGRVVQYDELPVPPGFGSLPTANSASSKPTSPAAKEPISSSLTEPVSTPTSPTAQEKIEPRKPSPSQHPKELTTRVSGNQQKNNLAEQQMKLLLERQKEFKLAAINAKKTGEIEQAKEYLKIYKGFDALLNAASSGLPVDLNTLPLPPSERESLEASFAIVTADECDPDDDISDIGVRMEEQLAKQLMMCKNTRDHHKAMGDVAGMNRFENLALTVQKDLDLVRYSKRKNYPLPKFHYEKRSFNIVHCNTDLTDNELEIILIRGINYNVPNPKEVDTYVKVEFPLLNDESFKSKTNVIKDTDSPDYNERFKVDIQRGNRQFQRIFKRHSVKFEVYSRGCSFDYCGLSRILPICCFSGFLRSDTLIGTVNVKLQPLETKCDIHDTYDLMEGRKQTGGKIEIKISVRNPILTKQIEHITEKWLVLEHSS